MSGEARQSSAKAGGPVRVVILGAGISGHTATRYLTRWRRKSSRPMEIVVVSPLPKWNYIPSNVWVGVGQMSEDQVTFDLAEVYRKIGVAFIKRGPSRSIPRAGTARPVPMSRSSAPPGTGPDSRSGFRTTI